MTTRYHSTSGVLSLNIQLTRSAGANNSPLPNVSYHQNNRQKLLFYLIRITVVALHHSSDLVSKFSQSTMFELVPVSGLTSVVSTIRVVFQLSFYSFTLAQFSCTGCLVGCCAYLIYYSHTVRHFC